MDSIAETRDYPRLGSQLVPGHWLVAFTPKGEWYNGVGLLVCDGAYSTWRVYLTPEADRWSAEAIVPALTLAEAIASYAERGGDLSAGAR